jgi:hypothetical protein
MKSKTQFIASSLALLFISLLWAQGAMAQHTHDHGGATVWKTGMLRVSEPVWAGNVRLKSGMYHVKHVIDGDKHVLVFKSVALRAGYQEGSMWEGKEVARLECTVEPVAKSTSNTKMLLGKNAAGEPVIEEIQIAGEKVKHVLSNSTLTTRR